MCVAGLITLFAQRGRSRDPKLANAGGRSALGDEMRQQRERLGFGCRFDRPPELMPSRTARADRRLMAERALVASERGERDPALLRIVPVLQQVMKQAASIARERAADIGAAPWSAP